MKNKVAIRIQNLSKEITEGLNLDSGENNLKNYFGMLLGFKTKNKNPQRILGKRKVLENISLEMYAKEIIGIVGESGSGKSILLKLMAGALIPSQGRIEIHGKIASLLNMGGNINLRLTARENIAIYHQETRNTLPLDKYIEKVLHFAEIEKFADVAVKTFSTGMTMRLGTAIILESGAAILLIDDVLTVGDIAFQQKCIEKLFKLKEQGHTMLLASNDEQLISQLSSRIITLANGHVQSDQSLEEWVDSQNKLQNKEEIEWQRQKIFADFEMISIGSFDLSHQTENSKLSLEIIYNVIKSPIKVRPLIDVKQGKILIFRSIFPEEFDLNTIGKLITRAKIPTYLLKNGNYQIIAGLVIEYAGKIYALKEQIFSLKIKKSDRISQEISHMSWQIEPFEASIA